MDKVSSFQFSSFDRKCLLALDSIEVFKWLLAGDALFSRAGKVRARETLDVVYDDEDKRQNFLETLKGSVMSVYRANRSFVLFFYTTCHYRRHAKLFDGDFPHHLFQNVVGCKWEDL